MRHARPSGNDEKRKLWKKYGAIFPAGRLHIRWVPSLIFSHR
jgi:hypothetical protein